MVCSIVVLYMNNKYLRLLPTVVIEGNSNVFQAHCLGYEKQGHLVRFCATAKLKNVHIFTCT